NIGGGVLLTANWFFFIYVMNHISVKATSLAYLVCPILTTLLAYVILKEKLSRLQWIAVALSITGCAILSWSRVMDMVFSLIIGLSYALYLVAQKKNTGFDKFLVLSVQIIVSAVLLLPFYPAYSAPLPVDPTFYICVTVIAVAFTIVPLLLNLYALKGINSSTAGMLLNINPLIAFSLATLVFHEQMDLLQIVAYGIIFLAVIVFNAHFLFRSKPEQQ
ncbi:MAG: EamA family transporter, partial [Sphingobacteriales bacterium]